MDEFRIPTFPSTPFYAAWRRNMATCTWLAMKTNRYTAGAARITATSSASSDFKNAQTILLEQNYRSTQRILDGAMAVIDRNANRTRKKLFTEQRQGEKIKLFTAADDKEEAEYVVQAVKDGIRTQKQNPSSFAVMYRTNAQSRLLEESFRREGLSYRLVGAQRFYGRREVKDVISFLRLIHNPRDEISLRRVINLPPRGIGGKSLEKLEEYARAADLTLGEAVARLAEPAGRAALEQLGKEGLRLEQFGKKLLFWRQYAAGNPPASLFDRVLEDTGYQEYIHDRSEEGQDRWENVMELRQVILEYDGLPGFLEAMALVADQDTLPETLDAPTMLTLHAAKGLEFENVFIVGLDEMILPHSRSRDDPEAPGGRTPPAVCGHYPREENADPHPRAAPAQPLRQL